MAAMEITDTPRTPTGVTLTKYGSDERDIEYDAKVKIQFIGPGGETLYQDGPAEGKKWRVFTQVHIDESDA